jgi:hypothetical protein
LDTGFHIGKTKLSSGRADSPFEVTPALLGEVQAYLGSDEVAELRQPYI